MDDLVDETVNHRKLPGEGEFPIRDYVAVCRELGYAARGASRCSRRSCGTCPIDEIFDRAYATSEAQLAAEAERSAGV